MKQFLSALIATASLGGSVAAFASPRPHYGGTLRIVLKPPSPCFAAAPVSLPASGAPTQLVPCLSGLVFETLVKLDDRGRPVPWLATSWQAEPGDQRWRFLLRSGVSFDQGGAMDANVVAASLRADNPEWKVVAAENSILVETASPHPLLPAELALARYGIRRRADGRPIGTGPFSVEQWDPPKRLVLRANDTYWAGRPFLDSIEVTFVENSRDQTMLMDLGKTDVIEVAAEGIHRATADGRRVVASEPEELVALVFESDPRSDADALLRRRLSTSIDVGALTNVVLRGGGEPAGAILPGWVTGYGFLFARSGRPASRGVGPSLPAASAVQVKLGYDESDPVARLIAERILLDARQAGIAVQLTAPAAAQARLVRFELPSLEPRVALAELAQSFGAPEPKLSGSSLSALYSAEGSLVETHRVIPLLHLRRAAALRPNVHGWRTTPDGTWQLADVWLSAEGP